MAHVQRYWSLTIPKSLSNDTNHMCSSNSNIDPDWVTPVCGEQREANINIKVAPDPTTTSNTCNLVKNYLVGQDGECNSDVNVVFSCPGQTVRQA